MKYTKLVSSIARPKETTRITDENLSYLSLFLQRGNKRIQAGTSSSGTSGPAGFVETLFLDSS